MRSTKAVVSLFCIILFTTASLFSQGFLRASDKNIVNAAGENYLLRGMGLGGWMLQEGYMLQTAEFATAQYQIREKITELIGEQAMLDFYESWLANHCTKADIDSLAAWGFNSVRLPMHYNLFTLPIEDEPVADENTWFEKGFELTDQLIEWCKANDMYVILDLHAAPGGQGYDQAISDYDPTKPSLWESNANKRKTIALWQRIAERYADEPTIAGYDLLNEVNWDLGGNTLRTLYREITEAIRTVDNNHIVFIEGNWFANDFTGLTPPWDDNMVYSPHKYWSINDQASIQWVLDLREGQNVPLYLGESGENSNVWFRDAIRLLEDNNIGWAWWPMKKVESISGPLSITKSDDYTALLNYWKGNAPKPSVSKATETLMALATNTNIANCTFQKDVIDAMFRQVYSDEAIPYEIQQVPGVVFASEFDLGVNGSAYYDNEYGNYSVSTGNYTPWNTGWAYRNDAVDLQVIDDNINSNGYNVGWMAEDEWMQYSIEVAEDAVYAARIRYAAGSSGGSFHLSTEDGDVSSTKNLPNTMGFDNWRTYTLEDVILTTADSKLIFHVDGEGYNLSSLEFIKQGELSDLATTFVSASTEDEQTIAVVVNKPLSVFDNVMPSNFTITVNGNLVPVEDVVFDAASRTFRLRIQNSFLSTHTIRVTYDGNGGIQAVDGTILDAFTLEPVKNNLIFYNPIPGTLEAEDYYFQSGVQLEDTEDAGGGQNVGYLDTGDYLDYYVNATVEGNYQVSYRTASESATGVMELLLIEGNEETLLHTISVQPTGGWQSWTTTSKDITLPKGRHQLRILIKEAPFNINWIDFGSYTATEELSTITQFSVFPNPAKDFIILSAELERAEHYTCRLVDVLGNSIREWKVQNTSLLHQKVSMEECLSGNYFLIIESSRGEQTVRKISVVD